MKKLEVVNIGGYGHYPFVFDDMLDMAEASLTAFAPAFDGEDVSIVASHAIFSQQPRYFDNYRKMLSGIKPDVAIISTRLDKITDIAIDAANAGCHLICEKPIALNYDSLNALYEAVRKNGIRLTAMLTMRSLPAFIAARNIYQKGDIGQVIIANGRKSYKWGPRPEWFGDALAYGGTIGWIGIHILDFINFITSANFTSVAAMKSNFSHPSHLGCEDNCVLIFELSNGGHATASIDYCRPLSSPTHGDDWVRIVGTKGVIEANASKSTCNLLVEDRESFEIPLPPFSKMFRNFLLSLISDVKYEIGPSEPFSLTYACLRAKEAAEKQQVLKIEQSLWNFAD